MMALGRNLQVLNYLESYGLTTEIVTMDKTVNAVNKHQARWPKGYVMAIIQDDVEVTYGEFMQCVKEMSEHGTR